MARKATTKGVCSYCGREGAFAGMNKHLETCRERQAAIERADASRRRSQALYHLTVRDTIAGLYWLHLEIGATVALEELDDYLRAIWVDCCGHMSHFIFGATRYQQLIDGMYAIGNQRSITTSIGDILTPGLAGRYEYDFGTTTELKVQVIGMREGKPIGAKPIALMARNVMPSYQCVECGEPATHKCIQCYYERGEPTCFLCAAHAANHGCTLYGKPRRLFNSPRTGICGYDGPAKPPY